MPLRTPNDDDPSMNLTPMIDCVMLLVIFFMVGTKFADQERQYEINLPTVSDAQPLTSLPDEIVVNVRVDGATFIKGKLLTAEDLEADLKLAVKRYVDQVVIIRGDATGPYQHVMTTLSLCQRAGIRNIKLANKLQDSPSR